MRILAIFNLMILMFTVFGCVEQSQPKQKKARWMATPPAKRTVVTKDVHKTMAGYVHRKRATAYLVVDGGDTSAFQPAFIEYSEKGEVGMDLNFDPGLTYGEQLNIITEILPQARMDYTLDSLKWIYIGRFIKTGDLVLDVSREYLRQHGPPERIRGIDYKNVEAFMLQSKMGRDFNRLFSPYMIQSVEVAVEKVFFTEVSQVLEHSKVNADSATFPEKALDCITAIRMAPIPKDSL